jgi:hypothetical protein
MRIELSHGFDRPESGPHGALGVIFMRQGVAEVDQQAIAEILGDMSLKAGDHLGAGVLIGPHHLAQLFRVELTGEHSRVYQVTKQHGEMATFSVRGIRFGGWDCRLARAGKRRGGLVHRLRGGRRW